MGLSGVSLFYRVPTRHDGARLCPQPVGAETVGVVGVMDGPGPEHVFGRGIGGVFDLYSAAALCVERSFFCHSRRGEVEVERG